MLGPLVLLVAATLAYVGYEMPRAADAEQLFKGGHELTAVTLRQLETVEVQVRVAEQSTRVLADSTKRVADVIPTKISMPRVPVTNRFWVSRHRRLRWENRSTPDQRQKPQAMAT